MGVASHKTSHKRRTEGQISSPGTRLVETGPGTVKVQHPPGAHDDIVTAVGMVVADLTQLTEGRGLITSAVGRPIGERSIPTPGPRCRGRACLNPLSLGRWPKVSPEADNQPTPQAAPEPDEASQTLGKQPTHP